MSNRFRRTFAVAAIAAAVASLQVPAFAEGDEAAVLATASQAITQTELDNARFEAAYADYVASSPNVTCRFDGVANGYKETDFYLGALRQHDIAELTALCASLEPSTRYSARVTIEFEAFDPYTRSWKPIPETEVECRSNSLYGAAVLPCVNDYLYTFDHWASGWLHRAKFAMLAPHADLPPKYSPPFTTVRDSFAASDVICC